MSGVPEQRAGECLQNKQVRDHLQPVNSAVQRLFYSLRSLGKLLALLPKGCGQERKLNYLTFMLSEPDSIYRYPSTFNAVDLICMPRRTAPRLAALPGPLVLEEAGITNEYTPDGG